MNKARDVRRANIPTDHAVAVDQHVCPNRALVALVIFDGNAKDTENEKLSALRNEIISIFKQTPTITRGYIVEQAIDDGWLKYDENSIKTIGAFIYL